MDCACESLTIDEIATINRRMIELFGGLSHPTGENFANRGALEHVLESILFPIFGEHRYPTVYAKAAALCYTISRRHVFNDGNKRTALLAAIIFLELNGFDLSIDHEEWEETMVSVAKGETDIERLAALFKRNSFPRR